MRRKALALCLLCGCLMVSAAAHDLFLKLDTYFLRPHSKATVRLFNGTFQASEGVIARDRLRDASIVSLSGSVAHPSVADWRDEGQTTLLYLQTGEAGTYVVGVSTEPKEIDLKAADFNEYLAHDGVPEVLAARRKNGALGKNVRERYSKHVRAVLQVGDARTDAYQSRLDYPVEIIPQQNPYSLRIGQTLEVLCTLDGKPLAHQFMLAGWEVQGRNERQLSARTDAKGIARFKIVGAGKWYVKMIHMTPVMNQNVDYESKWATLTFEIK